MKNSLIKAIVPIFLILLLMSCSESTRLDRALELAGENKVELEKVLDHYRQSPKDLLKYKAACFLIENMPGHYSYKDTLYIKKYYDEIDSGASLKFEGSPDNALFLLHNHTKGKGERIFTYDNKQI